MQRLAIIVDGGMVQGVYSTHPLPTDGTRGWQSGFEIVVIDYDVSDEEKVHKVPQSDDPSDTADAYIQRCEPGILYPGIAKYLEQIDL